MWVRRSDCESVTLREEFVGRLSVGSRLPQYLRWMLIGRNMEDNVTDVLHDCNVDWRSGAGAIDLRLSHADTD